MNEIKPLTHASQPVDIHTSEQEAVRITQQEDVPELVEFILALDMKKPVSNDRAARLIKHLVKLQTASDSQLIADQMRTDGWEASLSDGETLAILADRVSAYFSTHAGTALFNFFVLTFARTSGNMFG